MDNLSKYLLLLTLTLLSFSCQNRPSEVLSRKKMGDVMYDMYVAEALIDNDYQTFTNPENKEALINQVYKKHKISEARWDTSLSWYSDNIDLYLQINDSVKARLQRNQNAINQLIAEQDAQRRNDEMKPEDYIPSFIRIAGLGCNRGFKFKLDSAQLTHRYLDKDTLYFNFKTIGVVPIDSYSLKSMLRIEYKDTIVYKSSNITENKLYSFTIPQYIDNDTVVALNGFLNLSGKFPMVPIHIYNISLANSENDSIQSLDNEAELNNVRRSRELPLQMRTDSD